MNKRRSLSVLAGALAVSLAAMLFGAPSAFAINTGDYYCGNANNLPTNNKSVHRSGPNSSWYFYASRCASFKQFASGSNYYSTLMTGTFASFTIGFMNVPDAIDPTVFFDRMEYSTKWGVLCTATPGLSGPVAMGQNDKMNFGISPTTGDITQSYLIHNRDTEPILMRSSCTSGNHWISNVYIGSTSVTNGYSGSSTLVRRAMTCSPSITSPTSSRGDHGQVHGE
jgi:hypothetical protein